MQLFVPCTSPKGDTSLTNGLTKLSLLFNFQQITTSNNAKKLVLQRIEPWIKRELHAVLGDPDPSVIVHVATSLFISMHERKHECIPEQLDVAHGFLSPLWPFLHERTEMFWHELRYNHKLILLIFFTLYDDLA